MLALLEMPEDQRALGLSVIAAIVTELPSVEATGAVGAAACCQSSSLASGSY